MGQPKPPTMYVKSYTLKETRTWTYKWTGQYYWSWYSGPLDYNTTEGEIINGNIRWSNGIAGSALWQRQMTNQTLLSDAYGEPETFKAILYTDTNDWSWNDDYIWNWTATNSCNSTETFNETGDYQEIYQFGWGGALVPTNMTWSDAWTNTNSTVLPVMLEHCNIRNASTNYYYPNYVVPSFAGGFVTLTETVTRTAQALITTEHWRIGVIET
jgi:hypothetical protein